MLATQRYSFPSGVAFQRIGADQDGVMMSLGSGYLYRCNHTASVVLAAIAAGRTLDEAVDDICRRYGVSAERAQQDVTTLVQDLCEKKLLTAA